MIETGSVRQIKQILDVIPQVINHFRCWIIISDGSQNAIPNALAIYTQNCLISIFLCINLRQQRPVKGITGHSFIPQIYSGAQCMKRANMPHPSSDRQIFFHRFTAILITVNKSYIIFMAQRFFQALLIISEKWHKQKHVIHIPCTYAFFVVF